MGIQGKLYITATLDLQCPDDLQRAVPEHMVFLVRQGLRRTYNNGIPGVNADRINVFHITDRYGRIIPVPDHFIFDLFIALDAFFHQHFPNGRKFQRVLQLFRTLFRCVRKSAACTAQGKRRAQDYRITDLLRRAQSVLQSMYGHRRENRFPQGLAQLFEKLPVFRLFNGTAHCAKQFNPAFLQDALLFKLHRQVQACLSADSRQNRVRSFIPDDLRDIFQRQRLHVDLVRHRSICHNGSRIGVAQDHLIPFLPKGKAGLCSGIIKLRCLAYHDRTRTNDKDFPDISSFRHGPRPPPSS